MTNHVKPARVRFAPSPTGHLHLGGARTALYDYLLARQTGGQFILRIEDTDRKRLVEGSEQELMDGLRWLGLDWDEGPDKGGPFGPYRQSERKALYQRYARQLIDQGNAYYCFCSPERLKGLREEQQKNKQETRYDGHCRDLDPNEAQKRVDAGEAHVIRFKTPKEGSTTVRDVLRGEITVENRMMDDFIIVKSDGLALYHLAAMVDDHEMQITHVIRGSEWLSTFPLHGMIYEAFGWEQPEWVHLSIFLKPSGAGKLSKRDTTELLKDGYSIFVKDLEDLGYTPEGVLNWMTLMGWSLDGETEFFTINDLIEKFSLEKLNPSPAAINFSKLDHFNGLHIRALSPQALSKRITPYLEKAGYAVDDITLEKIAPIIQERMVTLDESPKWAGVFFTEDVTPDVLDLIPDKMDKHQALDVARRSLDIISNLSSINHADAEPAMRVLVEETGYKPGQVFGILRVAVMGQKVSPPLFESMEIIGRDKVLQRLKNAIALLEQA